MLPRVKQSNCSNTGYPMLWRNAYCRDMSSKRAVGHFMTKLIDEVMMDLSINEGSVPKLY